MFSGNSIAFSVYLNQISCQALNYTIDHSLVICKSIIIVACFVAVMKKKWFRQPQTCITYLAKYCSKMCFSGCFKWFFLRKLKEISLTFDELKGLDKLHFVKIDKKKSNFLLKMNLDFSSKFWQRAVKIPYAIKNMLKGPFYCIEFSFNDSKLQS